MLDQSTINGVKQYTDIVSIISEYVSLKKRGRNYIGLCPFHSEKSPSFTVSPEKRIYHCFGCHESGDHITFMMKIDNLSFTESIRHIAQKIGVEVIETELTEEQKNRRSDNEKILDILYKVREKFTEFFTEKSDAFKYLNARGLSKQIMNDFHVGVCPNNFDLLKFLKAEFSGITDEIVGKTGIFYEADSGDVFCRFKNRVVFPIMDHYGRTVGFGGRIYQENSMGAKYVNSEESYLFNKRRLFYALNNAKQGLKESKFAILMEGYMDVVTAHQFGFTQALGVMGTAITAEHAQLLKRHVDTVYLAMDNDDAGRKSVLRSYEVLRQYGFKVFVLNYLEKDPADYLNIYGTEGFQKLIDSADGMFDHRLNVLVKELDLNDINAVSDVVTQMTDLLKLEPDSIVVRHYSRRLAHMLKIDEELVMAKLRKTRYNVSHRLTRASKGQKDKVQKAEESLIYFAASSLEVRYKILELIEPNLFVTDSLRKLFEDIVLIEETNKLLLEALSDVESSVLLSKLLVDGDRQELMIEKGWQDCVAVLLARKKENQINVLKAQILEMEKLGETHKVDELMKEMHSLINTQRGNYG